MARTAPAGRAMGRPCVPSRGWLPPPSDGHDSGVPSLAVGAADGPPTASTARPSIRVVRPSPERTTPLQTRPSHQPAPFPSKIGRGDGRAIFERPITIPADVLGGMPNMVTTRTGNAID